MSSGWTTIESDPGVFTELIQKLGTKGVQVEELFTLEKESLEALRPVYGLIFLFKWKDETETRPILETYDPKTLFFAQQMISNACATQAILSILLNHPELDLGDDLSELREFCQELPCDMRGLAIGNSSKIRDVHNSFARPEPFVHEQRKAEADDDVFHFLAYLPVNGTLYELDGLKRGPIVLAEQVSDDNWLDKVLPHVQERVGRYHASEMRFNLMAIVQDRVQKYENEIQKLENERRQLRAKRQKIGSPESAVAEEMSAPAVSLDVAPQPPTSAMASASTGDQDSQSRSQNAMDVDGSGSGLATTGNNATTPSSQSGVVEASSASVLPTQSQDCGTVPRSAAAGDDDPQRCEQIDQQLTILHDLIRSEKEKFECWRRENIRRKHNYIPFIVNFIKILADRGVLSSLVDEALEEQQRRSDERRKP